MAVSKKRKAKIVSNDSHLPITSGNGGVCFPLGFKASYGKAGVRQSRKPDVALILCDKLSSVGLTTTTNNIKAWCVLSNAEKVKKSPYIRALICTAGNANCCNGERGKEADIMLAEDLAEDFGCDISEVLTATTGIIGRTYPIEKVDQALPEIVARAARSPEYGSGFAGAIMTTDSVPKQCELEIIIDEKPVRFGGSSKGSGMIAPNMATMFGFVTTDAKIEPTLLQKTWSEIVDRSFNAMSVDGDTSTNDMGFVIASGESEVKIIADTENYNLFYEGLLAISQKLAKLIARDGEGATKLIEIRVSGIKQDNKACRKVAKTIAESMLVKTACFGNDPNWGRILMAVGRSGVPIDANSLKVSVAGHLLFDRGEALPFDGNVVSDAMRSEELIIEVEGNLGGESSRFWTCDLSYDYVKINAEYTT